MGDSNIYYQAIYFSIAKMPVIMLDHSTNNKDNYMITYLYYHTLV